MTEEFAPTTVLYDPQNPSLIAELAHWHIVLEGEKHFKLVTEVPPPWEI